MKSLNSNWKRTTRSSRKTERELKHKFSAEAKLCGITQKYYVYTQIPAIKIVRATIWKKCIDHNNSQQTVLVTGDKNRTSRFSAFFEEKVFEHRSFVFERVLRLMLIFSFCLRSTSVYFTSLSLQLCLIILKCCVSYYSLCKRSSSLFAQYQFDGSHNLLTCILLHLT